MIVWKCSVRLRDVICSNNTIRPGRQEEEKEEEKEETVDDPSPDGNPTTGEPQRKRRRLDVHKVDQSKRVDIQSLPANPLLEVALFGKLSGHQVEVFVGNKVYVVNPGDADVSIPRGALLCGYGRGKFDRNDRREVQP